MLVSRSLANCRPSPDHHPTGSTVACGHHERGKKVSQVISHLSMACSSVRTGRFIRGTYVCRRWYSCRGLTKRYTLGGVGSMLDRATISRTSMKFLERAKCWTRKRGVFRTNRVGGIRGAVRGCRGERGSSRLSCDTCALPPFIDLRRIPARIVRSWWTFEFNRGIKILDWMVPPWVFFFQRK